VQGAGLQTCVDFVETGELRVWKQNKSHEEGTYGRKRESLFYRGEWKEILQGVCLVTDKFV
jgi:hypothetical protein